MKRYLVLFFYEMMEPVFLYKDIGSIALSLSKYYGWQVTFAYLDIRGEIKDNLYQKYVNLTPIHYEKNRLKKWKNIITFIWKNSKNYDVLNFYFGGREELFLALITKIRNPNIKVYVKMDLVKEKYIRQINLSKNLSVKILQALSNILTSVIDLYTVECRTYIFGLNKIKRFRNKVKYLPNGFFDDLVEVDKDIKKEKIILTVGRLGTLEKNTEMLVEAIENIETEKLKNWKIYLVGSMTDEFTKWFNERLNVKPYLKNYFIVTGNISDKKELYTLYAKSSVFVLPSRWESWGLALTEAMAFGCFPIVTDCCDAFYEILDIANSNFGKIIPTEDKNALINAIEEVLDNKVDYINNGIKAHEFVSENFDWEIIAQKLDNYFREIYETRLCTKKY